jgi:hypothetical protein
MARVNFIAFTGLSPLKEELVLAVPLPFPFPNDSAKLALPIMVDRDSEVRRVEVLIAETGARFDLDLIEDMGLVIRETFKAHESITYAKTLARVAVKAALGFGLSAVGSDDNNDLTAAGLLLGLGARIAADVSERADTRMARYHPRYAYGGGVNLEPGVYSCRVNFYGSAGLIASYEERDVSVAAGKLNLRESVCLR